MTIELKPEQEKIIQEEIRSGYFQNPAEVLDSALAALQEKEQRRKKEIQSKSLVQFLMESPFHGSELDLSRQPETDRDRNPVEFD